jgi:XapX domain-containing protein
MKILIAFMVAFGIGAASRWTGVPSLAPQAIVGALLIVAMSTGYVSADRFMKRNSSPSVAVSVSTDASDERDASGQIATYGLPADSDPEADLAFWRRKSEDLQLIIADLISANQQLRAARGFHNSKDSGGSAHSYLDVLN